MFLSKRFFIFVLIISFSLSTIYSQTYYDNLPEADEKSDYTLRYMTFPHTNIKYYFNNFSNDLSSASQRTAIKNAFNYWCPYTALTFTEVFTAQEADIKLYWQSYDGPNGVLAYVYLCCIDAIYFDEDETWTIDTRNTNAQPIDLYTVAAHEIGHILGLGHTTFNDAIMLPSYSGSHRYLVSDDIDGVKASYNNVVETNTTLTNTTVNDFRRRKSSNSLSASNNYIINSSANVAFNSPVITLGDGFQSVTGSIFIAFTDINCGLNLGDDGIQISGNNEQEIEKTSIMINPLPTEFKLSQNYPNPFNPTTLVQYALKENVNVKITVYDILGRVIKTLVNEFQDAGYKSVMWDGTNSGGSHVSTGLYIYKIEAGNFVDSKKMLLLK